MNRNEAALNLIYVRVDDLTAEISRIQAVLRENPDDPNAYLKDKLRLISFEASNLIDSIDVLNLDTIEEERSDNG